MLRLLEWLREIDASLLSPASADRPSVSVWGAVLAVIGGTLVLTTSLTLGSHAVLQMLGFTAGMVMTVPYLQDVFDKARATVRE